MTNWKKRYEGPLVGKLYKLRRHSDKCNWDYIPSDEYDYNYTLKSISNYHKKVELEYKYGVWCMNMEFLKKHFKEI